jgi:large subunit ribosomal protein L32e
VTEQGENTVEKALKLRRRVKKRKPEFVRQESWRYRRLKENWRRPRGIDNKMRRKIKGWPPTVNVGYKGPKAARGLHPSGYKEVLIHNAEKLKEIDPATQAVRIAHTVGKRTRAKILVEARKRKVTILNLGEAEERVEEKRESVEEKKEGKPEEKEEIKKKAKIEKPKGERRKTKKRKRRTEEQ